MFPWNEETTDVHLKCPQKNRIEQIHWCYVAFILHILAFFDTLYIDLEKTNSSFVQCNTLEQNCHGLLHQSICCLQKESALISTTEINNI